MEREEAGRIVRWAYEGVLRREADEGALAVYIDRLVAGDLTVPHLLQFFTSQNELFDRIAPIDPAYALSAIYSGEGECGDPFLWRESPNSFVFFHFPKTAGMALRRVLMRHFHPLQLGHGGGQDREPGATYGRYQRFFCMHMSWAEYCGLPAPRHTLTVLRDPRARLRSLYRFFAFLNLTAAPPFDVAAQAAYRGPAHLFEARDPAIVNVVDNHYVRMLAGAEATAAGDPLRDDPAACLSRAIERILAFDAIYFVEELADSGGLLPDRVLTFLDAIGMPIPAQLPRENSTPDLGFAAVEDHMLDGLTHLDDELCRAVTRELGIGGVPAGRSATSGPLHADGP